MAPSAASSSIAGLMSVVSYDPKWHEREWEPARNTRVEYGIVVWLDGVAEVL